MGQYCDSKALEKNWFNWLVANATPVLEEYRTRGLLLTKVVSKVAPRIDAPPPDPFWGYPLEPRRAHCIAVETPVYCNSYNGRCDKPRYFVGSRPVTCGLPSPTVSLRNQNIIDKMLAQDYIIECPATPAWDAILMDVQKICQGIARKFNLPSDEDRNDLISDALVQTVNKIKSCKLIYTPGRAPVFNLLTTTIHRIMFSILNKETKDKRNKAKHAQLVLPLASKGQSRLRGRIITRRIYGSLVACQGS